MDTTAGWTTRSGVTLRPTSPNSSGYWGFLLVLLIPFFYFVWRKGKNQIIPPRIRTQRFFNAVYNEDMDALIEEMDGEWEEVELDGEWEEVELNA